LAHHKKNIEAIEGPKNKTFYEEVKCLSLWPNYIGDKGKTMGKTYGIKTRCYWNTLEEHIGNLGNI
jgi:hypothetical protein